MAFELRSARYLAQDALSRLLCPGSHAVDATMGNGHDTLFLARLVGAEGHVTAFDLQASALSHTQALLEEHGVLARCTLHCLGHQHMAQVVTTPVDAVMFNLGWLPGGDKSITTQWETTHLAIEAALSLLRPGGLLTVCAYPGHPAGDAERRALADYFAALRPQDFNVLHQRFLNAGAGAPECFLVQKQGAAPQG